MVWHTGCSNFSGSELNYFIFDLYSSAHSSCECKILWSGDKWIFLYVLRSWKPLNQQINSFKTVNEIARKFESRSNTRWRIVSTSGKVSSAYANGFSSSIKPNCCYCSHFQFEFNDKSDRWILFICFSFQSENNIIEDK